MLGPASQHVICGSGFRVDGFRVHGFRVYGFRVWGGLGV